MPVRSQPTSRKTRNRSRDQVKAEIVSALRPDFNNDTIDVSDGYEDNIHVVVVSRKFDKMSEQQKQDYLWRLIDASSLTSVEKGLISLVYPISPAEIK